MCKFTNSLIDFILKYIQIMQLSHWEWDSFFRDIDVLIVGSGIVGLSAALALKRKDKNLNIVIVERGVLPSGASTRNAGFACFGSVTELLDDLDNHSENTVFSLVEKRWKGLQRLRALLGDQQLQYESLGAYELFKSDEASGFEHCADQITHLNKKIAPITGEAETFSINKEGLAKFGFQGIEHLIFNRSEGQLNTGQMMAGLLHLAKEQDVNILNGLAIAALHERGQSVDVQTEQGWHFNTKKVLVATNGFTNKLLDLDVSPARNQVLITQPIQNLKVKGCFHYDKGYVYFRNVGNRLLLGGGRNLFKEQETTADFGITENIQSYLKGLLQDYILPGQKIEIDRWWSGILGVGKLKKPIIQQYSENITVAVRLGGMGVAIGVLTGEEGAECVLRG